MHVSVRLGLAACLIGGVAAAQPAPRPPATAPADKGFSIVPDPADAGSPAGPDAAPGSPAPAPAPAPATSPAPASAPLPAPASPLAAPASTTSPTPATSPPPAGAPAVQAPTQTAVQAPAPSAVQAPTQPAVQAPTPSAVQAPTQSAPPPPLSAPVTAAPAAPLPPPAAAAVPLPVLRAAPVRPRAATRPAGVSGHFVIHRDGRLWRITNGRHVVRGEVEFGGFRVAPSLEQAARLGEVTLFVDGVLTNGRLSVRAVAGSVPDRPRPVRRFWDW